MKQIIIIDALRLVPPRTDGVPAKEQIRIKAVFWFPVVPAYVVPLTISQVTLYPAATEAEKSALRDGTVIEEQYSETFTEDATAAQIRQTLVTAWNARKALIDQPTRVNLAQFVGASYDGTWVRA